MCEANIYLRENADDEYKLYMESVDKVTLGDDEIIIQNIFGSKKILKAKINSMELVDHKILVERI